MTLPFSMLYSSYHKQSFNLRAFLEFTVHCVYYYGISIKSLNTGPSLKKNICLESLSGGFYRPRREGNFFFFQATNWSKIKILFFCNKILSTVDISMSREAIPYKQFISALITVRINCTVYCGFMKIHKKATGTFLDIFVGLIDEL